MTGDVRELVNVRNTPPCVVGFADGGTSTSIQMGDMILTESISLKDVLFVPNLDCTLISVSKLLKHSNCFALFTDTICVLQDRSSKTLIGAGEERGGVYYFKDVRGAQANRADGSGDRLLWHKRLGHPAFGVFDSLHELSGVMNKASSSPCDVCFRAKQTRDVFNLSINKTEKCFVLIHVDVWGPYRVPASCGAVYFLTVVDDFSRAVWTYLLLSKSEVKKVIERFCAYTETQFDKKVQKVRSDNGSEFMCMSGFFQDKGIVHQTSCVDTPQQNGRVERKHRHILNVARALLFQSKMPVKFWGEAISTATHVINMTPSQVLKGSSPYEILFGAKPSYGSLRVFGSLCYVHRRDRDKDKLGERSRRCVFVGYPFGKKAWRVYDLDTNEFIVSRDVSFCEDVFPYVEKHTDTVQLRELTGTPDDDWVVDVVAEDDRGESQVNDATTEDRVTNTVPVVGVTETEKESEMVGGDKEGQCEEGRVEETSSESGVIVETKEVTEMGRGCREKVPSVKLRDYISYNAQHLKNSHHVLPASATTSESSITVQGKTPYPLANYISDEYFSPDHKAFLAAIKNEREP